MKIERYPATLAILLPAIGVPMRRIGKLLASIAIALILVGCKLVIVVPAGGRVVSDNGVVCVGPDTCVLDISDSSFIDNFEAVPDEGYLFDRWESQPGYFCGDSTVACLLTTIGFSEVPVLADLLATDSEFYLVPIFAESNPRYDVDEWALLLSQYDRTAYKSNEFLYQISPDAGNCDGGVLNTAATDRFLYVINLIRKLHYVPPVDYDSSYNTDVQQAALVQKVNGYLTHSPSPSDTCYSAAAAAGAGSSNLAGGSSKHDPAYFAVGWANDNYNISSLMEAGHRRWVLYPYLGFTSYGQVGAYSAMKVFGFSSPPPTPISPDVEYIAYPYRDFPYVLMSNGSAPSPWSITMVPPSGTSSRFDYFSQATVTVTETQSGNPMTVTDLHHDTRGYGLANFLSWMVTNWEYDTDYTVTISNITMPDSSTKQIEYAVMVDRANLLN